ncbi:hypothetical protein DNTS_000440 [Danionella cerebrum]|uniref:EGF-like domain-containing protein n=1 Tax=Danionella cerebrum TaxID=2873325 RepID=A0A553R0A0_9TELE|nr:hypothetical protein DNTS_000440 [Danionella translucida]
MLRQRFLSLLLAEILSQVFISTAQRSGFSHQPKCMETQGMRICHCEAGYTITLSGRQRKLCTDIDECKLFHNGQGGRLCLHECVNTVGGYRCECPAGYNLTSDGRNCRDIDECSTTLNNCTHDELCINTYGGFECVKVECPTFPDANYIKTSAVRCERSPCPVHSRSCSNAPSSISFHHLSLVSGLSAPRVVFRLSVRGTSESLRFSLKAGGSGRRFFSIRRFDPQTAEVMLTHPVPGPTTLGLEIVTRELYRGQTIGRLLTKLKVFVSQYDF